jgi:type I restriction enzyme S subunit
MKDSGVAWVGEIPTSWEIVRFKNLMLRKSKKLAPTLLPGAISFGRVVQKDDDKIADETRATYQEVLAGEILINPINLNYDLKSLRTALSEENVCVSPAYIVARPRIGLSKVYLKNLLYCFDIAHMKSLGAGVRQTITFEDIGNSIAVVPPSNEQRAIADYLDQQTALIDQRLSTLEEKKTVLAELRKATIHEAVTKGLNKNAPMKDSGVAWIGEIPQGWDVRRMKDCYISNNRVQPNSTILSLSYGKVIVKDMTEKKGVTPDSYDTYQGVHPGDVVLRLTDLQNDQKSLRVGRATSKGIITSAYLCVSSRILNDRYSAYLLHDVGDIQKLFYGLGGGVRQSMKFADLAELLFSLPPANEQLAIANHLDHQTQHIDAQLATLDEQAQVLKELRKAIIHEAVTGKIDLTKAGV